MLFSKSAAVQASKPEFQIAAKGLAEKMGVFIEEDECFKLVGQDGSIFQYVNESEGLYS